MDIPKVRVCFHDFFDPDTRSPPGGDDTEDDDDDDVALSSSSISSRVSAVIPWCKGVLMLALDLLLLLELVLLLVLMLGV